MRTFTLEQYKKMAAKFSSMTYHDKLKTVINNGDILTLCSDGNWWGVKVKDEKIQAQLDELDIDFDIEREWNSNEMHTLVSLLGIGVTDI